MNPQMMEQAQNMMRNMTPEQMADMRQMMSQMSPEQMASMQHMAANMGLGGSSGATPQSSQAAYHLSGARVLKEDGNALHKAGHHADALLKYSKALDNLAMQSSAEAMALKTSCGPNIKALYRRGQAYLGLKAFKSAAEDLQQASQLCPSDDTAQQALIVAKLAEAKKGLAEHVDNSETEPVSYNDGSVTIEEVLPNRHVPAPVQPSAPHNSSAAPSLGSGNGDAARARLDAMCNMPEEQLRQTASAAGMPEMDGKLAKQMAEMMRGMDPQQLNNLMAMSEQLHNNRTGPGGASAGSNATSMDPAVAVDMMRNMSPEQIENMAKAAAGSGMMPPGVDINPELLKQSAELMKKMTPEELQQMQDMASTSRQTTALPAQAGAGNKPGLGMGGMSDMLKDPKAMKHAMSMMKQMDEGQLANLMKMNQPSMSDEDARLMARQMKRTDDRVMSVVFGGISLLAQARAKVLSCSEWLMKNPAALAAILLLVIAVALRYMGIM